MDPLSVAASVVGLLIAAVQVSQVLSDVISKAKHTARDLSGMATRSTMLQDSCFGI